MPNSHTEVYVHLVWATWNRQPLITPAVEKALYACLASRCRDLQAHLLAVGGVADHVHVLLRLPATSSVSQVTNDLKGASSHLATHELHLPDFRWQGAYGARSVTPNGVAAVRAYIENQKRHHGDRTVRSEWERASDAE